MLSSDPLSSPAVDVLLRLEAEGFFFEVTSEGRFRVSPAEQLTTELMGLVRQYRDDLVVLTRVCDEGVQARVIVFRRQVESAPPGVVLPLLVFRQNVPCAKAQCWSCGDALRRDRYGRCWRCALAWRVAVRVPLTAALEWEYDDAAVS